MPAISAAAAGELPDGLTGPEFTDPKVQVEMPGSWLEKDITRIDWARETDVAVTLDQQLYPALLPLIEQYAHEKQLKIAVQEGTCGISAGKLNKKQADIAGFCCPAGTSDRLPGLEFHTLAIAPLVILMHPDNPVDTLDRKTVQSMFLGDIVSWQEVGSQYNPHGTDIIQPVGRLHCKNRPGHWRSILDNENLFSPRLNEVSTISNMISAVASDPFALGYETLWMTRREATQGDVKAVDINGVSPFDEQDVLKGRYPFYRVYNLTTWQPEHLANRYATELVTYLKNNIGQVDPKFGFIPYTQLQDAGWRFEREELIGGPALADMR